MSTVVDVKALSPPMEPVLRDDDRPFSPSATTATLHEGTATLDRVGEQVAQPTPRLVWRTVDGDATGAEG